MNKKTTNIYFTIFLFLILYISILLGLYLNEDNLGGAAKDFNHHFKISEKMSLDFLKGLNDFGNLDSTRNSPIFWIFIGFVNKFFSYEYIKLLNTLIIFPLTYFFYRCLELKYKNVETIHLVILSSFLFLSPSLRSLIIWPYSLSWGLLFFIISIFYYLKNENNLNLINSLKVITLIIISSYIYPSFSVFYLFYIYKIFKQSLKLNNIIIILILSFIMSLPCLYYILTRDIISSFNVAQGVDVSIGKSFNLSNKVLIISTLCLYAILPIINFNKLIKKFLLSDKKEFVFIIIFCLINFYYFNFPNSVWGGGFFHKISHIIFENNILFFLFAFISISVLFILSDKEKDNYFLLIILILFNPQFTIYLKYYDPLIFIIFLTLFKFNLKTYFLDNSMKYFQFYGFIVFYYIAIYSKKLFFDFT